MSTTTQGSLTLFKLRNGATTSIALSVDKQLTQIVQINGSSVTVSPDWSIPANQPTITPIVGNANYKLSDIAWYYNGSQITFPSSQFAQSGNSLKIIANLASRDNLFTDTISIKCKLLDLSNNYAGDVEKSIDVPIMQASANGYTVLISSTRNVLDKDNPSTTLTANLYQGAMDLAVADGYKWYIGTSGDLFTPSTSGVITVTRDDVSSYLTLLCKAYSDDGVTELDAASITIYDIADEYSIVFSCGSTNNVTTKYNVGADEASTKVTANLLKNGSSATGTGWSMQKLHGDTIKLIAEVVGKQDYTADTTNTNTYNTTSSNNITVYSKDYVSNSGVKNHDVEVLILANVNI